MVKNHEFINESYPKNPDEIVIKNKFYRRGLTEKDVYNYYIENKEEILRNTEGREIMFIIFPKVNQPVVKRKDKGGFINLNKQNYDEVITGRTVSIHNTMKSKEEIGIIDIDYHDFNICKDVAKDLYEFLREYYRDVEIRFSGKTSFHVIVHYQRRKDVNQIRDELTNLLQNEFSRKYLINATRSRNKPNLDLSPNKFRGAFICLGSLSSIGLKCMTVKPNRLSSFRRDQAAIK